MRHSDSSPSIPPRFVAFARRYHPSTCGFAPSDARCCVHGLGLLVSRCPPPGGLYDGDDEASRVPGKPTRTHATRSDPGEVAASTASEMRRDSLPSNARRRPSQTMHFGAQSRGLRAPCERFAPWVTPGPRITRFRLAADLGRMGLDTHRVSNKVSKITSRHLVPLDRAFPAHTLVHESLRPEESRDEYSRGNEADDYAEEMKSQSIRDTRRRNASRTGLPTIAPSSDEATSPSGCHRTPDSFFHRRRRSPSLAFEPTLRQGRWPRSCSRATSCIR